MSVMVSLGAEESPPLAAGTAGDVFKGLGSLLECSEADAVGMALLGTPVSSEEPETLLAVPVRGWSSIGEAAELGEVPLPAVVVARPPLAGGVVRVVFVTDGPGPEEALALGESPPLSPGADADAFLLVAAEFPAPEGAPVVVGGLPLPSSDVAVGPVLAVDGRETEEMLLFITGGLPADPDKGSPRVDMVVEVETVALGEGIVDGSACAELRLPPPLAPAPVRDVPSVSVGKPTTLPFANAPPMLSPGVPVGAVADAGVSLLLEGCGVVDEFRARGRGPPPPPLLLLLLPAGDPPLRVAAGMPAVLLLEIVLGPTAGIEYASAGVLCVSVVEVMEGMEVLLLLSGEVSNVVVAMPEEVELLLLEAPVLCCTAEVGAEALVPFWAGDMVDVPSCVETLPVGEPLSVLTDRLAVTLRTVELDISAALGVEGEAVVVVLLLSKSEEDAAGRVLGLVEFSRLKVEEACVEIPDMAVPLLEVLAVGKDAVGVKVEPVLMLCVPRAKDEVGLPLVTPEPIASVEDTARVKFLGIGVLNVDVVLGLVMLKGSSKVAETPRA